MPNNGLEFLAIQETKTSNQLLISIFNSCFEMAPQKMIYDKITQTFFDNFTADRNHPWFLMF